MKPRFKLRTLMTFVFVVCLLSTFFHYVRVNYHYHSNKFRDLRSLRFDWRCQADVWPLPDNWECLVLFYVRSTGGGFELEVDHWKKETGDRLVVPSFWKYNNASGWSSMSAQQRKDEFFR